MIASAQSYFSLDEQKTIKLFFVKLTDNWLARNHLLKDTIVDNLQL